MWSPLKFWSIWKYYCVINPWLIYLKILTHFKHFYNSILKGETFLRISCILWAIPSLRASLVKEDDKESVDNAGDPGSTPGSGRSPRGEWQPTPVFLPGEFHGQRNLEGCIVCGVAKSQTWLKWLRTHAHIKSQS